MGNWVTVEALRQIKISANKPPIRKLGAVVLAAPDIDIDVLKAQMRRFGKPRKPFFIVLSRDDKALRFSNFIAGGKQRLGAL
ncbi:MAG TPA: alpha/beta hydrolase [Methyloceanibacter sp.]|nr:alpha/beta hydrolase [Methyloceanibacter sp.]